MKPLLSASHTTAVEDRARYILAHHKVALFVVAYNAERHIHRTLSRIPTWCRPLFTEIYVIDDSSKDTTFTTAQAAGRSLALPHFSVMRTPDNQGYGGNQKIGYTYAIQQEYDIVILLHGDGQYPPEHLPALLAEYTDDSLDAVFGSRMIRRSDALRGGMPLYKWVGNQVLTSLENTILGTHLTEFHSGYRSYRTRALTAIPFHLNSDDFHFDTDIIIQLIMLGSTIKEIPMPTHYGDEECHVDGMKYAWNCFRSAIQSRLHRAGLFFQPNFEITGRDVRNYHLKHASTSLHNFILRCPWKPGESVADLGANDGLLSQAIAARGARVTAVDMAIPETIPSVRTLRMDLNGDITTALGAKTFHQVVALDVIEHLHEPEISVAHMHALLKENGILLASTANIGYIVMRLTHLLGWFNYGKKGILDRTHHRLFTIGSFRRLLHDAGFDILRLEGFGPPLQDAFGSHPFWRFLDRLSWLLAKLWPTLFAFNFLLIAKKHLSTEEKLLLTEQTKKR